MQSWKVTHKLLFKLSCMCLLKKISIKNNTKFDQTIKYQCKK